MVLGVLDRLDGTGPALLGWIAEHEGFQDVDPLVLKLIGYVYRSIF